MKNKKILIKILIFTIIFVVSMTAFGCSCKGNKDDEPSNTTDVAFDGYFANNTVNINVGDTYTLNALNVKITEWSSSDEKVVSVDENGVVFGKAQGVAFVYAVSEEGQTLCCVVSVMKEKTGVKKVTLSESEYYMGLNDVYAITADVIYEGEDLGGTVEWSVSNDQICTIEKQGNKVYVSAKGTGETFVVASLGGKVAQCKLIIREQKSNQSSYAELPTEMATAEMTKNYYELGRLNNGAVQNGEKSTIYQTVSYKASTEKYSIVAFATLADGKKDLDWTAQNYFAYGFYLKTIKVYDSDTGMQGQDRIYYAYNGTDDSGKYGIEIDNVPNGYYAIYSFVEYVKDGVIVKEISKERVLLGEYDANFINGTSDFTAFMINRSFTPAGVMAGYETKVVEKAEAFDGVLAKYQISAPVMKHYNYAKSPWNVFPSVMVKAQTAMSKEMLQEMMGDGISVLRFKVCYRIVSEKTFSGVLDTTNFVVLDDTFPKTVADVQTSKPPTYYDGVSSREGEYEKYVAKAISSRQAESNVWYTVEYKIKDLIEDYDIFFHEKAEYPFFNFSINHSEDNQAGNANDAKVLITDFEFVNIAYDNIFAEQDSYSFVFTRNGKENYISKDIYDVEEEKIVNWQYLTTKGTSNRACNPVEAESGKDVAEYKGKQVAYKFKYTIGATDGGILREQKDTGRYLLMAFNNRLITKSLLEELLSIGYTELNFSVVIDDYDRGSDLKLQLIDFTYLKANASETLIKSDRYGTVVNWKAFKLVQVNEEQARDWYTISYSITDLLACYDQIFNNSQVLLAEVCAKYSEGTTAQDKYPYYYVTKVGFKKGIDIENSEDIYPDIFN